MYDSVYYYCCCSSGGGGGASVAFPTRDTDPHRHRRRRRRRRSLYKASTARSTQQLTLQSSLNILTIITSDHQLTSRCTATVTALRLILNTSTFHSNRYYYYYYYYYYHLILLHYILELLMVRLSSSSLLC